VRTDLELLRLATFLEKPTLALEQSLAAALHVADGSFNVVLGPENMAGNDQ
jgi:hypothetical protein